MKVSDATLRGLRATRHFIRNNVGRFVQMTQAEKDAILDTMMGIDKAALIHEVGGDLILHPFLRDCNLDAELLVEALTLTPTAERFEAGVVELSQIAEALRKGRIKLDRLNAEIKQKQGEIRVLKKVLNELTPQAVQKQVEVDIETIVETDPEIDELFERYSMATEEQLTNAIRDASGRTKGILSFIASSFMGINVEFDEQDAAFSNGYVEAREFAELMGE